MVVQGHAVEPPPSDRRLAGVADWFSRRSYEHDRFASLEALARKKLELGLSLSVVLPCREVADTIGAIADEIHALNEEAPLVDEVMAVDAGSADGTAAVARRHGLDVYAEDELMSGFGPTAGKGDAMWRALSVARGDLVMYLDSDTTNFDRHYVYGLLGPILSESGIGFVKATYHRPFLGPDGAVLDDAGRVTELTAKPLLRIFYPALAGFGQPLSGELVARRDLLTSIPFLTGYAVEVGMLIDVLHAAGLDAMAQVGLGARQNRSQSLRELGSMSYAVARAVMERALGACEGWEGIPASDLDSFVRAVCTPRGTVLEVEPIELNERPPMAEALPELGPC
jgi:glucosyl-3-phosphoglycerate synthase